MDMIDNNNIFKYQKNTWIICKKSETIKYLIEKPPETINNRKSSILLFYFLRVVSFLPISWDFLPSRKKREEVSDRVHFKALFPFFS